MAVSYQLVIDCASTLSARALRVGGAALRRCSANGEGFDLWETHYRSIGAPEDELGIGNDSIVTRKGRGSADLVPGRSRRRSRSRTASTSTSTRAGAATNPIDVRRERVEAEAERLVALAPTRRANSLDRGDGPLRGRDGLTPRATSSTST